jgi:hypothetical protein
MARRRQFNFVQVLGGMILAATTMIPGQVLANSPNVPVWSYACFLFVAACGGMIAGLLISPSHRVAGMIGGMIAGPLSLLAVMFYLRGRVRVFRVEIVGISLLATVPGLAVYFLLRLITDAIFPPKERRDRYRDEDYDEDEEFDDYDDRPRRRRRPRDDYDEDDEDDRRRRRRSPDEYDEDVEDDRPRRGRRSSEQDNDEDDDRPRPKRRRRDDDYDD